MQLVPLLMALRDTVGLERVVVDTYQSVSRHRRQGRRGARGADPAHAEGRPKEARVYPHPIAFNALPEIDVFLDNGYSREEWKVVTESRKILHLPDLRISCTAVRDAGLLRHSEAVHVETRDPITPAAARELFAARSGRRRPGRSGDPPLSAGDRRRPAATRSSSAGSARTRRSPDGRGLAFWVVSDNIRKGAATNAVEIAELLVTNDWLAKAVRARPRDAARTRKTRVTEAERRVALEQIATEVRVCTRCRLHEGRTRAVPGEGNPDTEVVFVGEGPGLQRGSRGPAVRRARRARCS